VISEARKGDAAASEARLDALVGIRVLALDTRAKHLTAVLIGGRLLPLKAAADAEHIAIAATNDVKILLTWNCKHLANPTIHRKVVRVCEGRGLCCPEICMPEQLMRTYAHARSSS
jgi:hypothetical protein